MLMPVGRMKRGAAAHFCGIFFKLVYGIASQTSASN